jgi:hypothetical protein
MQSLSAGHDARFDKPPDPHLSDGLMCQIRAFPLFRSGDHEWALAPDTRSAMIQWTGADAMWIMVAGRYRTGGVDAAKRMENPLVPNAT